VARVAETGVGFAAPEALTARDVALERLLMGLRIDAGVPWAELAVLELSADAVSVRDLADQGLVVAEPTRLAATRAGRAVLDGVVRALV
jgi:coproporphyrinogen III oxidase-like Fe-S oxidoreductase